MYISINSQGQSAWCKAVFLIVAVKFHIKGFWRFGIFYSNVNNSQLQTMITVLKRKLNIF